MHRPLTVGDQARQRDVQLQLLGCVVLAGLVRGLPRLPPVDFFLIHSGVVRTLVLLISITFPLLSITTPFFSSFFIDFLILSVSAIVNIMFVCARRTLLKTLTVFTKHSGYLPMLLYRSCR